ncbi:MAG TPA: DUF2244 domain-containing protein [Caldimonas sp.]|jgi:uncharacterized membrane protein|nr:DUF2244 domain-containing protein [Caldimonas sp.]HEX2540846.1 DUF2244 domain-containing protein [Caldimonas sp.]
MAALSVHAPRGFPPSAPPLRFASSADGSADGSVQWLLRRNCSIAPSQLLVVYVLLCIVSLAIAGAFWWRGAPFVLPFASLELLGVGVALLVYARHAADRETLSLRPGLLTVECTNGRRVDQVEFTPAWVRVEPAHGDHSLIELSGEGKRISVGRFVRPELRRALAEELRAAIRRCGTQRSPRSEASASGSAPIES